MRAPLAVYNELDPVACAVLREAASAGVIAQGAVIERSIKDVTPDEIRDARQFHAFAGAGLWSVAARLAGWPDDRALWSASCPCQAESVAGKRLGPRDPRDLWPDFFALVDAVRPPVIVGEQVDAAVSSHWLDRTAADLENAGYAFRAVDIPACAVDAPHRRNRLYWVAVADADRGGHRGRPEDAQRLSGRRDAAEWAPVVSAEGLFARPVGDSERAGLEGHCRHGDRAGWPVTPRPVAAADGSFWRDAYWLSCADGKARRAPSPESYFRDVADVLPAGIGGCDPARLLVPSFKGRTEAWKLAGNAIVPVLAAEVLASLLESAGNA